MKGNYKGAAGAVWGRLLFTVIIMNAEKEGQNEKDYSL